MAIIRLTDIVTVMKNKWTYGDKFFGYTDEFNDNHNTQYPSLLITPPSSIFPEVSLNNGWEEYTFEIYFSDLYNRTAQANVNLDQRWDNLQDLSNEWLDMFLKNYQDGVVTGFLEGESVTVERVKEVANDQLLQIRMQFTWRVFSKCFRPVSVYPTDITTLISWLKADSGLTFNIPTKKISSWKDLSVSANNLIQVTSGKQPLRYTYNGANDKTRIEFDGTNDSFISTTNNLITTEFTIFQVLKSTAKTPADSEGVYGYLSGTKKISISSTAANTFQALVSDGTNTITNNLTNSVTTNYFIGMVQLSGKSLRVDYDSLGSSVTATSTDGAYDDSTVFNTSTFTIGLSETKNLQGNIQEFIIYNSALSNYDISNIKGYLNKKYNIY